MGPAAIKVWCELKPMDLPEGRCDRLQETKEEELILQTEHIQPMQYGWDYIDIYPVKNRNEGLSQWSSG